MKKKTITIAASVLMLSSVLSACGSKENNNASPAASSSASESSSPSESAAASSPAAVENFDISLRHIQISDLQKFRKAILEEVVAKSEADVPGAKFEMDPVEDSVQRFTKLPAEMAAGNPPKIFDLFGGPGDGQKYARAGKLLDLTPILDELGIKDQFTDFSTFVVDGKVYGLPIGASSEGFFYNTEILAANNIAVPKTMDELDAAFAVLKAKGITPMAMGSSAAWVPFMLVNTLVARYAGPEIQAGVGDGSRKLTEPEVVNAFAKYEEWIKKGYFTKGELGIDYTGQINEFIGGKAAFLFDGTWRASAFTAEGDGKALAGKVGYFAMPAATGGKGDQTAVNYNQNNGYGFSADVNDNEKAAIKAFIKNLYSEEYQIRGFKEDGVLPSMKVDPSKLPTENPLTKEAIAINAAAGSVFPHFDSLVAATVNGEFEKQIQNLIAGKATAQKATEAIQQVQDKELAALK